MLAAVMPEITRPTNSQLSDGASAITIFARPYGFGSPTQGYADTLSGPHK